MANPFLQRLSKLKLPGIAVSAAILPSGKFESVRGIGEKLLACARERTFPRAYALVCAGDQYTDAELRDQGLAPAPHMPGCWKDPNQDFTVVPADTLEDAVGKLDALQSRFSACNCAVPTHDPDYVGRKNLFEAMDEFIQTRDTGYLVLYGHPGVGKSSFFNEYLHRRTLLGPSQTPIFHIVPPDLTDKRSDPTGPVRKLARCLYSRLWNKYLPQWEPNSAEPERKLQQLISHLGESEPEIKSGRLKEVIFIDAADQAIAGTSDGLPAPILPGILPLQLPAGFLCIITTGTDHRWLACPSSVTKWELKDYANDGADVETFVRQRAPKLARPLSDDLIRQIVANKELLVFLTVHANMKELEYHKDVDWSRLPTTQRQYLERLYNDPNEWTKPSTLLFESHCELILQLSSSVMPKIQRHQVWSFLAPLVVAPELLRHEYEQLGVWDEEVTGRVVGLARQFFAKRPRDDDDPSLPYVLNHPGYGNAIAAKLSESSRRECHYKLAQGCGKWRQFAPQSRLRAYALQHRLRHFRAAKRWPDAIQTLAKSDFIISMAQDFDFADVYREVRAIAEDPDLTEFETGLMHLEHGLRIRLSWLTRFPGCYGQELANELHPVLKKGFPRDWEPTLTPPAVNGPILRKCSGPPAIERHSHSGRVACVAWRPHRILGSAARERRTRIVATGGDDGAVKLWDADRLEIIYDCRGHRAPISAIAFSSDGSVLFSKSMDASVKSWDVATGLAVAEPTGEGRLTDKSLGADIGDFPPEAADLREGATCWSRDGSQIAVGYDNGTVKLLGHTGNREIDAHAYSVTSVSFSDDCQLVASARGDRVVLHSSDDAEEVATALAEETRCITLSPDGRYIVCGAADGRIIIKDRHATGGVAIDNPGSHSNGVNCLSVSHNGLIASGGADGTLKVWRADNGAPVGKPLLHPDAVTCVRFSRDGSLIASGCADGSVRVWEESPTRTKIDPDLKHATKITCVGFSPDGEFIASGSDDGVLRVWKTGTGRAVAKFGELDRAVRCAAFSSNSQWVASGGDDGTVQLWNRRTGEWVNALFYDSAIIGVAFLDAPPRLFVADRADRRFSYQLQTEHVIG